MNHWNDLSITSPNFVSKGFWLMVILYNILTQLTVNIIIFQKTQVGPGSGALPSHALHHSHPDHLLFLLFLSLLFLLTF